MQTFLNLNTSSTDIIVSNENNLAINLLENKKKFSIIIGPKKSGKSILAKKFAKIDGIEVINNISKNLEYKNSIFLDLNELPLNENYFFHFLQYFIANNIGLTIFTSSDFLKNNIKPLVIPDTLSRLKSFNVAYIDDPKDELLFRLIEKFLMYKSISVSKDIIQATMGYINRTYMDAFIASETINHLLYKNNHNINLSLIRQHYE